MFEIKGVKCSDFLENGNFGIVLLDGKKMEIVGDCRGQFFWNSFFNIGQFS